MKTILFFTSLWVATFNVFGQRAISGDNLAVSTLVSLESGISGSGFYLQNGTNIFFVTARHVLLQKTSGTNQILNVTNATFTSNDADPKESSRNVVSADLVKLLNDGNIVSHTNHDVAVIRLGKFRNQTNTDWYLLPGAFFKESSKSGMVVTPLSGLKKIDEVLIPNAIYIIGYPRSLDNPQFHPKIEFDRPLVRRGIVAGINNTTKSIILDCAVYKGNSGGPVLQREESLTEWRMSIIGVVSEFVPLVEYWSNSYLGYSNMTVSNSGYAIAEPMDFVIELIEQFSP
jgi:V8-like Glu-specific endopeptidase